MDMNCGARLIICRELIHGRFFGGHLEKMHGTDLALNCRPKNSLDLESAQNLALKKHRFKKMSMICPTLLSIEMFS